MEYNIFKTAEKFYEFGEIELDTVDNAITVYPATVKNYKAACNLMWDMYKKEDEFKVIEDDARELYIIVANMSVTLIDRKLCDKTREFAQWQDSQYEKIWRLNHNDE